MRFWVSKGIHMCFIANSQDDHNFLIKLEVDVCLKSNLTSKDFQINPLGLVASLTFPIVPPQ